MEPDRHPASDAADPVALPLQANDWVPNNPRLPALHYRAAFATGSAEEVAAAMEARFNRNGWPPQWRDGIYAYHHYHTAGHEVLGIARGHVRVMLGGPDGEVLEATAGDVLVLPAGTGHCRLSASPDFLVVGAYPPGQEGDICTQAASAAMLARIAGLDIPGRDPVAGLNGPLGRLWPR